MLNYYHQIIILRTLPPFGINAAGEESTAQAPEAEMKCATFSSLRDSGDSCCFSIFSLSQLSWKSLSLTGLLLERTELYLKGNFGANRNRSVRLS